MSTEVTEREAREVAEAAREREWKLPSFGKELFLGNFRLDLISPQPGVDPVAAERGEEFLARLRTFLQEQVDPLEIERDAKIPDEVIDALKDIGALGMKTPEEYGGLGLSQVHYNEALAMAGMFHAAISTLLSAHQSIGVGVDPWLRMDQIEPEVAEEQLLAEARKLPLGLAGGLGDLPRLLLAHMR